MLKAHTASMVEKSGMFQVVQAIAREQALVQQQASLQCTSKPSFPGSLRHSLLDTVPQLSLNRY